jgi:hypothetical protein
LLAPSDPAFAMGQGFSAALSPMPESIGLDGRPAIPREAIMKIALEQQLDSKEYQDVLR